MRTLIVGGDFGEVPKKSSIIDKIGIHFQGSHTINGGSIETLTYLSQRLMGYELVIWMPNVSNETEKVYPKKMNGTVLICSKVLRPDRDKGDAVSRIFKMNANAVIAIDTTEKPFTFHLIDALANTWYSETDIEALTNQIKDLFIWTKQSIRLNSKQSSFDSNELVELNSNMDKLCDIVHTIANKVEDSRGGRYFGNISTRCAAMFPSMRVPENIVLMSARNSPKKYLTGEDFVITKLKESIVLYNGDKKPSVDSPIQLSLYEKYSNINFIVHGHAFIKNILHTKHYCPCGDMREFEYITEMLLSNPNIFCLNL